MKIFQHKTCGFTYLELLTAIVIMGLAIVPIMQMMPGGMIVAREMNDLTQSVFLAQWKMEEVRARALGTDASYGFDHDYSSSGSFVDPYMTYRYVLDDDNGTSIKIVSVAVWNDRNGNGRVDANEKSVRLDTSIAKRL